MLNYAYSELYIPLSQRIMGDMYDFAINTLGYDISEFQKMFIASGIAYQFEIGNPTYVAGKNGCEIAREIIGICTGRFPEDDDVMYVDKSREYWIGWSIAYYQWCRNINFSEIYECVSPDEMYGMYVTLHEADISVFVDVLDEKCNHNKKDSMLKRLRKYAGLTQNELSERSGVPLRQIQLFEQGQRDINKTQSQTLLQLSKALNCDMEKLLL